MKVPVVFATFDYVVWIDVMNGTILAKVDKSPHVPGIQSMRRLSKMVLEMYS